MSFVQFWPYNFVNSLAGHESLCLSKAFLGAWCLYLGQNRAQAVALCSKLADVIAKAMNTQMPVESCSRSFILEHHHSLPPRLAQMSQEVSITHSTIGEPLSFAGHRSSLTEHQGPSVAMLGVIIATPSSSICILSLVGSLLLTPNLALINVSPEKGPASKGRGCIPSKNSLFCGRVHQIRSIVSFLTQQPATPDSKRGRFCILGTGGMGKTSLTFEVMLDEEIKECYGQKGLIWGPCAQALSPELLLDTLHNALGLSPDSRNPLQDILNELRSSGPVLLLLDNFETPWNAEGRRAEVAQILRDIEQLPNVALLLTMRATYGPCDEIKWREMRIEPLDVQASSQLYTSIYPESKDDRELPELLNVLGHMPLAIKLMAQQGKNTNRTAAQLIKSYQKLGTGMLGPSRGSDRQNSMDISIQFSLESSLIQNEPDARLLLIRIAILLGGTTYDVLEEWWASGFPNLYRALQALLETSLLEHRNSRFFVLPVIRSYVLDPSRCPSEVHQLMVDAACSFLARYNSIKLTQSDYKDHCAARSAEEINLQTILLVSRSATIRTIQALLTLAEHQYRTRTRLEVIEHAVQLAKQLVPDKTVSQPSRLVAGFSGWWEPRLLTVASGFGRKLLTVWSGVTKQDSNRQILADALFWYAHILRDLHQLEKAVEQYTLSREVYLEVPNPQGAAEALLNVAYTSGVLDANFNDIPMMEQARREFESIPDKEGAARCLIDLGASHSRSRNHAIAIQHLMEFRALCPAVTVDSSWCAHSLSLAHHRLGQYTEAESWALTAYKESKQLGNKVEHSLRLLAKSRISTGNFDQAIPCLEEALQISTERGTNTSTSADILLELGRAWMKKGDSDKARDFLMEASRMFETVQGSNAELCLILCPFYLRKLQDVASVPAAEEMTALLRTDHNDDIYYGLADIANWVAAHPEEAGHSVIKISDDIFHVCNNFVA
ncbi:hypothetical protein C8J56DRAFT_1020339 [Mycena floridula]|nr:hypothetical protein C8J56DRAFT_1020339 [Mycena floridula]